MKDQVLEHIWQVRRSISDQNDFDSKKLVAYYKGRATRMTYPISGSTGGQKFSKIAEPPTTYDAIRGPHIGFPRQRGYFMKWVGNVGVCLLALSSGFILAGVVPVDLKNISTNEQPRAPRQSATVSSGELYMVIDLSGGTNATSYPVFYLNSAPADGWTDEYKTSKLVMRKIPKGTFMMGSPINELGRHSDETQHTVTLTKDFYIGVFEVTQRQWELVMGNRPSYLNNATYYATRPVESVSYYDIRENPENSDDPAVDWPANSAVNATSFIGRLRAKTGLSTFDLPTESQGEYACRAATTTALNTGYNLTRTTRDPLLDVAGRYRYNGGYIDGISSPSSGCTADNGTAKVGTYPPNAWGLYDMHGNVWEWCLDWYGTYPGASIDPIGSATGSLRVGRGGSWIYCSYGCRSANRYYSTPNHRIIFRGFRAAMTLP